MEKYNICDFVSTEETPHTYYWMNTKRMVIRAPEIFTARQQNLIWRELIQQRRTLYSLMVFHISNL